PITPTNQPDGAPCSLHHYRAGPSAPARRPVSRLLQAARIRRLLQDRGLHAGERQAAADSEATPEGHVLRFNDRGEVIGLTIINAKWLLQRDHAINITIPEHVAVTPDALAEALTAA
ncbi:MAG TPA: hypothetical protein VIJ66_11890, partial [Solirubrobacteraceae bacterium]